MTSELYGLVLAGGQSRRMGQDKGSLVYRGKSQRQAVAELLAPVCSNVFVSCRPGQTIEANLAAITDIVSEAGPLGGILSAFATHPHVAWLVVACDMPLLTADLIHDLVGQRRPESLATAFCHPEDGAIEPLLAIWEAAAIPLAQAAFANGLRSPRHLLQQLGCHALVPGDPQALQNINTPDERTQALSRLQPFDGNPGNVS